MNLKWKIPKLPVNITINVAVHYPTPPRAEPQSINLPGTVVIGATGKPWIRLPDSARNWLMPGKYALTLRRL